MKVGILAFDDFTDIDLILHWDILNRVKYISGISDWSVQILGSKAQHLSTFGLPIPTSGSIEDISKMDGVIICSGKGTREIINDDTYLSKMKLDINKQVIGAQCSGSLILGALGFLNKVEVSAYPPILKELEKYNSVLVNKAFVQSGNLATASSCLAGQYLSNWFIERLVGVDVAKEVMLTLDPIN